MDAQKLQMILEAALLAAGKPLSLEQLEKLFDSKRDRVGREAIRQCLKALGEQCHGRGYELKEVASGYRLQVRQEFEPWVSRLWEEKPPRYSRALMETLALIVYRQPITRAEIEQIRGVGVSTSIIKTLLERGWVRVLGHKEVPGRPALYGSARAFLDYFNLKTLDDMPNLAQLKDLDAIQAQLDLQQSSDGGTDPNQEGEHSADKDETPGGTKTAVIMTLPGTEVPH
ncbi:MAG: SMC-Scp complex subunit ScpB [Pseudomonadota bacterium]